MTWLRELKPLHPGCAIGRDLKSLSVLQKSKQLVFKKCFHELFHVMITNEVPVMILQAYFSLPRHIRNGMLIRMIITSDLCTAVGCQQFCKESRKLQRKIMFERNYSFYHHCCCLAVTWCSINSNLSKTKMGGGHGPPGPPRSDGTEYDMDVSATLAAETIDCRKTELITINLFRAITILNRSDSSNI